MLVKDFKTGNWYYDGTGQRGRLKGTLKVYRDGVRIIEERFDSRPKLTRRLQSLFKKVKNCEISVMFDES